MRQTIPNVKGEVIGFGTIRKFIWVKVIEKAQEAQIFILGFLSGATAQAHLLFRGHQAVLPITAVVPAICVDSKFAVQSTETLAQSKSFTIFHGTL